MHRNSSMEIDSLRHLSTNKIITNKNMTYFWAYVSKNKKYQKLGK